jgi:hypothetical protein
MFFVLKFELILIIGSNNVLTEGARKYIAGAFAPAGSALDRAAVKQCIWAVPDKHFIVIFAGG